MRPLPTAVVGTVAPPITVAIVMALLAAGCSEPARLRPLEPGMRTVGQMDVGRWQKIPVLLAGADGANLVGRTPGTIYAYHGERIVEIIGGVAINVDWPHRETCRLTIDGGGTLYAASENWVMARRPGGAWEDLGVTLSGSPRAIWSDPRGNLTVVMSFAGRIDRRVDGRWHSLQLPGGVFYEAVWGRGTDFLALGGTGGQLAVWEDGVWSVGNATPLSSVADLAGDNEGRLLALEDYSRRVALFNNGQWHTLADVDAPTSPPFRDIALRDGTPLAIDRYGLWIWRDDRWQPGPPLPERSRDAASLIVVEGELFLGLEGGGVLRESDGGWELLAPDLGVVVGFDVASDGTARLLSSNGWLMRLAGDRWVVDERVVASANDVSTSRNLLARDRYDHLVAVVGGTVFVETEEEWRELDGMSWGIDALLPQRDGTVLIISHDEVWSWDGSAALRVAEVPETFARGAVLDGAGKLWIATDGHLYRVDAEELVTTAVWTGSTPRGLVWDERRGLLIFGGDGCFRVDPPAVENLTAWRMSSGHWVPISPRTMVPLEGGNCLAWDMIGLSSESPLLFLDDTDQWWCVAGTGGELAATCSAGAGLVRAPDGSIYVADDDAVLYYAGPLPAAAREEP